MKIIAIGFTGNKRHGKSASAEALRKHLWSKGIMVLQRAFGDAGKEELATVTAFAMTQKTESVLGDAYRKQFLEQMYSDDSAVKERWRQGMQWYMTEFRRTDLGGYPAYWTDLYKQHVETQAQRLRELIHAGPNESRLVVALIADDLRFDNEADCLSEITPHCSIYKIIRSDIEPNVVDTHSSEAGISEDRLAGKFLNDHSIGLSALTPLVEQIWQSAFVPHLT